MATRRDREEKTFRERERFLRDLADVATIPDARRLIMQGGDASFRSNAGYVVRFGVAPRCDATETAAYEALLVRLKAAGYRWETTRGGEIVPMDPDGKPIIIP